MTAPGNCDGAGRLQGRPEAALFAAPTIFDEVSPSAVIAQEEVFGPVLAVFPFDTAEECTRLANDTMYGLAATWIATARKPENAKGGLEAVRRVIVSEAVIVGAFAAMTLGIVFLVLGDEDQAGQEAAVVITSLTSPVAPDDFATLAAQTEPHQACSLAYATPSGRVGRAQGFGPSTADEAGVVTWTWKIGSNTAPGDGSVEVRSGDASVPRTISIR